MIRRANSGRHTRMSRGGHSNAAGILYQELETRNMSTQPASPPALPDVNAQTYPYDMVQAMLDQTANFSMFAVPVSGYDDKATLTPGNPSDWFGLHGGYGLHLMSDLHRFEVLVDARSSGVRASQEVGQATGKFHC